MSEIYWQAALAAEQMDDSKLAWRIVEMDAHEATVGALDYEERAIRSAYLAEWCARSNGSGTKRLSTQKPNGAPMLNEHVYSVGYQKALAVIFKKGRIRKSDVVDLVCRVPAEELPGVKHAFYSQGPAMWRWYCAGESARMRKAADR